MSWYVCTECGVETDSTNLQPSTDTEERYRLGVCPCTKPKDTKTPRRLSIFKRKEPLKTTP